MFNICDLSQFGTKLCIMLAVIYYVCSYVLLCQTWECFVSVKQYCSGVNIDLMNFALNKSKKRNKNVSNGDNI